MPHLFVVRHAQTDFNDERRYQGAIDVALNATGVQQAKALAKRLQTYQLDAIVSSPLKRALGTARILARTLRRDIEIAEEFRERSLGVYEGLTPEEVQEAYPELWAGSVTRQINDAPPREETILEVGYRVLEGLNQLKQRYGDKNVLLVTHGFIARVLHGVFNRISDEQFYSYGLDNCEVVEYYMA